METKKILEAEERRNKWHRSIPVYLRADFLAETLLPRQEKNKWISLPWNTEPRVLFPAFRNEEGINKDVPTWLSYFSVSVIKYHDQGNLQKEEFMWVFSSRGMRVHLGREAWQDAAVMAAGGWDRSQPSFFLSSQSSPYKSLLHHPSPSPLRRGSRPDLGYHFTLRHLVPAGLRHALSWWGPTRQSS